MQNQYSMPPGEKCGLTRRVRQGGYRTRSGADQVATVNRLETLVVSVKNRCFYAAVGFSSALMIDCSSSMDSSMVS